MKQLRALTTLAAASIALAAAPAALAHTATAGSTNGSPNMNVCLADFDCTYINYKHGKPSDVVAHTGTLVKWSLNAGLYYGEQIKLRVLEPVSGGRFKATGQSSWATVSHPNVNTFSTHIKVKAGDVLAVENTTSSIMMATAPSGECIHYFDGIAPSGVLGLEATGQPDKVVNELHTPVSAKVDY